MFVLQVNSNVFFSQLKKWVNSFQDDLFKGLIRQIHKQKVTKLGSRKLHICPKVTKMGSKIGHRIDYNGVGALRGQRHIPSKYSPPRPRSPENANVFERVAAMIMQIETNFLQVLNKSLCQAQIGFLQEFNSHFSFASFSQRTPSPG